MCITTHWYVWHDSFKCVPRHIQIVKTLSDVQHDSSACATCLNESSVNPKSTSNQSSKPCTVLQYPSKKRARNVSCTRVPWIDQGVPWNEKRRFRSRSSTLCLKCLAIRVASVATCHRYKWVMSQVWMSHGIHMDNSCHTYEQRRSCRPCLLCTHI